MTTNTIQSGFVKHAWIRDNRVPQGQPALGKIDCPCGQMPWTKFDSTQPNIVCKCGTEYTWNGWIVKSGEAEIPGVLGAIAEIEKRNGISRHTPVAKAEDRTRSELSQKESPALQETAPRSIWRKL